MTSAWEGWEEAKGKVRRAEAWLAEAKQNRDTEAIQAWIKQLAIARDEEVAARAVLTGD